MPLSITKLVNLLGERGFYVKTFYKVYGVCAFIEIISSQNANNYMLYIPSKYNFKIASSLDNVYDLKQIDVETIGLGGLSQTKRGNRLLNMDTGILRVGCGNNEDILRSILGVC